MSFSVTLKTNWSENERLGKSTTDLLTTTCVLKEETSIVNPVLFIECDASIINQCNYLYIAEFKRYYFVKNITSVRNNLWNVTCHCDVLDSFSNALYNCKGVIKRQENNFSKYLNDGAFKSYSKPRVQVMEFPNGFNTESPEWVLIVSG